MRHSKTTQPVVETVEAGFWRRNFLAIPKRVCVYVRVPLTPKKVCVLYLISAKKTHTERENPRLSELWRLCVRTHFDFLFLHTKIAFGWLIPNPNNIYIYTPFSYASFRVYNLDKKSAQT